MRNPFLGDDEKPSDVERQAGRAAASAASRYARETASEARESVSRAWQNNKDKLAGPRLFRVLAFFGGLALVLNLLGCIFNIFSPVVMFFDFYLGFFGLVTLVIEIQDLPLSLIKEGLKPWIEEWFKFLTTAGGRGMFYVFLGLAACLNTDNIFSFKGLVGLYILGLGVLFILIHYALVCKVRKEARSERRGDRQAHQNADDDDW